MLLITFYRTWQVHDRKGWNIWTSEELLIKMHLKDQIAIECTSVLPSNISPNRKYLMLLSCIVRDNFPSKCFYEKNNQFDFLPLIRRHSVCLKQSVGTKISFDEATDCFENISQVEQTVLTRRQVIWGNQSSKTNSADRAPFFRAKNLLLTFFPTVNHKSLLKAKECVKNDF